MWAEYTLTELLYTGDAHVLHRGYRNADSAPVVVKLPRSETPSLREIARLRHEYLICRDIDAPGVVKVVGLEKTATTVALILEDFGGRPLNEILRAGRLDLEAALAIASSLAEGVAAVHDRHVIHRDIKPHNVLVNTDTGAVKLTDFGLATRLSHETQNAARPDALEGTLAYMSPEQTGRMNRVVDARADLYSFGVTLYQMLAGALPFPATDPMELVHSHIARTPPPLGERAAGVPEVVSAIVTKLLAKAAEDRYQSAHGLKLDLDECLKRLREEGQIQPFPLGRRDTPTEIRIAQKLYGRAEEQVKLLAAFERTRAGAAELVLIAGPAGVGKSALVSELSRALAYGGGYFVSGKFEQRGQSVPYTAIMAALRDLVRHVLAEPAEALARWKSALSTAVGTSGQLLIDLIPDLSSVIGPQPAVPDLGPSEAQNRLGLVFQNFVRVFAAREHPVVLFLDDLQWADPAELRLLSLLLTDPERGHLLIAGAYRDRDLGPFAASLREQGAEVHEIALSPLGLASAEQLVADALVARVAVVKPFARLVFDKTQGNPLFMGQFLRALHADGIITFDRAAGAFRVDMERAREAMVTDNVVDLMTAKIQKLAPHTQRVLRFAACIGHQFDLRTLSVINETKLPETAAALWEALEEGLVVPLDAGAELAALLDTKQGTDLRQMSDKRFRFLHDRVQQAAYALIDEPRRKETHLRIGRLLLAQQSDGSAREERLLEIVDHLNLGALGIADRAERIALARLNLTAGKRARAAAAYQAAAGYLAAGISLLDEASWSDEYALAFALHMGSAECESLSGRSGDAEPLFDLLLARAETRLDRARVYTQRVVLHIVRGEVAAALRNGRAGLLLFGADLPEAADARKAALDAELDAVNLNLRGHRIADLAAAPSLTDPDARAQLELLVSLGPAGFFIGPMTIGLVAAKMVNLCLLHGRSEMSDLAFTAFGHVLILLRGRYEEARAFFQLGVALAEMSDETKLRCHADVMLLSYAHFFIPLREMVPIAARAQRAGLASGAFVHLYFACYHEIMIRLSAGFELGAIEEEIALRIALLQRTRSALPIAPLLTARQMIAALTGRTSGPTSLSSADFDEAEHLAKVGVKGFGFAAAYQHFTKLELSVLYGDHATALAMAAKVLETAGIAEHYYFGTDVPFYAGLSIAGLYLSATAAEKEGYAEALRAHEAQIALWATHGPQNFRHKELLLAAEAARIAGRDADARELYDKAIDAAREGEFTHHEALANELAAMYYLGRGKPKIARLYLEEARHGYLCWGATEKARILAEKHAALIGPERAPPAPRSGESVTTTSSESVALIDNAALVRAAEIIVGEIVLDRLLDRLMRIMVAHAGADRAVLLLSREGKLVIEAMLTVDPDVVHVGLGAASAGDVGVAESVISFVARTREPVVLGDTAPAGPFSGDAYLAERCPRSLLCLAMVHQGRLAGVLYLENRVAREAFTRERVELSSLLASHAAVAVENALLVDELQRRTRELGESNEALRDTNEKLSSELHAHEQAEAARAALKAELYRVQTPLIPITDRIMVMPLIGTVDEERARQILETALHGVSKSRASVVILDVTGVDAMDGGVTSTLVSTANALRLLGAQAVITGIRPEVARDLVALGVDLGSLVTRGTLQGGIVHAMQRIGAERDHRRTP